MYQLLLKKLKIIQKLLREGFKRSIYWNKYKIIFKNYNDEYIRRIDVSFQGVNKFFVLPYADGDNIINEKLYEKCFLPPFTIIFFAISKLMVEMFMINQLMTQLNNMKLEKYQQDNNMMKLEKYQHDKVMIIQLVVY